MKRVVALVLCLLLSFSCCFAEEILTHDNCEDFATILDSDHPGYKNLNKFADANLGKEIEFDGCIIENQFWDTYVEVYPGDVDNFTSKKAGFHFIDITEEDIHGIADEYRRYTGETFDDEYAWMYLHEINIQVAGIIKQYDKSSRTIEVETTSIHLRLPDQVVEESEEATVEAEPAPEYDESAYSTLENGSNGDDVKALQQRLIDLKYLNDKADGSFGNKTKAAVEKFQTAVQLEATGVADPKTQAILFSDDAPEAKLSISSSQIVIGSYGTTTWYVDGESFTLKGSQTKTVKTAWGTYKFDALGNYEKLD